MSLAEDQWTAVVARDKRQDGQFYYSVKTTGVYCRPSCAARLALRKNVAFHSTPEEAERAGFRPCKRCRPKEASLGEQHSLAVEKACRVLEKAVEPLNLDQLATVVGLSPYHLHRLFKAKTGVTPRAYSAALKSKRVQDELDRTATVTEAIYSSGFNSNGRFYELSSQMLGMTPTKFRSGGNGVSIRFAVAQCSLGSILVAAAEKGICAISLGDDPDSLVRELENRFPKANLAIGDQEFERQVAKVIGLVEKPGTGMDLPLDIQGTLFQRRVWQALREIPVGKTASYSEIAGRIGAPKSVRAVARACASNTLAVAIPCHRVVRSDGALSGYRWGAERKKALLSKEELVTR